MHRQIVLRTIDAEQERFIDDLQRLVRQPSISSTGTGVRACAELLIAMMRDVGISARLLETDGFPAVFGELPCAEPDRPTLLIYSHYDVQPPEPLDQWRHPPFAAVREGDRIIGRGATDAKGNLMAVLKAVDAYQAAGVPIPLNLKFIFDGEEESGSPSMPALLEQHRGLLAADSILSVDGGFDASGRPRIQMGSSGLLEVRMSCRTASKDLHSARARLVTNPAWRLVWALASMKSQDERITVQGFYDQIVIPTPDEEQLLQDMGWDDEKQMRDLGVTAFINGVSGVDALRRLLYQPTININGVQAGHAGEGSRTVLPGSASVSLDLRLVPNQTPEVVFAQLQAHLQEHGFDDIQIEFLKGVEPSRAPLDSSLVRSIRAAAEEQYGGAAVKPRGEASGRSAAWIGGRLGIPAAMTSLGPPAWLGHAPNEFMTVGHYIDGIRYLTRIWSYFAASTPGSRRVDPTPP